MRYDSLAKNEERICAKVIEMECHPSDPFLFFPLFFPFLFLLPSFRSEFIHLGKFFTIKILIFFLFKNIYNYLIKFRSIEKNYTLRGDAHSSFDQSFSKDSSHPFPPHRTLKIAETWSIDFASRHVDRRQADQASNYLWQRRIREARRDKGRRWQQTFHSLLTFPALESLGIRGSNTVHCGQFNRNERDRPSKVCPDLKKKSCVDRSFNDYYWRRRRG